MNDLTKERCVLVASANGKTGRRVARRLLDRGVNVRGGSRTGTPPFSWEDPTTWPAALAGVTEAYVAYHPDIAAPAAPPTFAAFGRALRSAGVEHVVLLSGRGEPQAIEAEDALRSAGGFTLTVLRAAWFSQNFDEGFLVDAVRSGVLAMPAGETGEPFVDAEDIADVAVATLLRREHRGQVHELTGPRLLTFHEVAEELSAASGRNVVFAPCTHDELRGGLAQVMPAGDAAFLSELFTFLLDGHNARTTDTVTRLLGRPASDFRAYAKRAAASGAWRS